MARYQARYFFDAGSGICLWASNVETRARFGYPIDISDLPVSAETKALTVQVVHWYDASLNWWYPPDPLPEPWTPAEKLHFDDTAGRLLAALRAELGRDWEVVDGFTPLAND